MCNQLSYTIYKYMFDYQNDFPLLIDSLPERLQRLLRLESIENPSAEIEVATRFEKNKYEDGYEYIHMIMACIPENDLSKISVFAEATTGLVKESIPCVSNKGGLRQITLDVSGYDYIVASWGDGAKYSYNLAEKVWMTLGLTPRLLGNEDQRIIYDDLSSPLLSVASGDVSCEYEFTQSKNIKWTMRNDYLRNFLWMKNCYAFRVFYYESYIEETDEVNQLLSNEDFYNKKISIWGELCIRRVNGRILIQLHAVTCAVEPDKCHSTSADQLIWPNQTKPFTRKELTNFATQEFVYVKDEFLVKYEKDTLYEAIPFKQYGDHFYCSPSYKGQWSFQNCLREGRNLFRVSLYELYKNVPDEEIFHVHGYALTQIEADQFDLSQENIVLKTEKFLLQLCSLNTNLTNLDRILTGNSDTSKFSEFVIDDYKSEGFRAFPVLEKLYQVAPINMYKQDFLGRCKTINEILMRLKPGSIKNLLAQMGVERKIISDLKTLKLLQVLLNLVEKLDNDHESKETLIGYSIDFNVLESNPKMASLFINNDLRNAEAHESVGEAFEHLRKLGFDSSSVQDGYGKALDFMFDKIIDTLDTLNRHIENVLNR